MTYETENGLIIGIRLLSGGDIEEALSWRMEVLENVFAADGDWPRDALHEANEEYLNRHLGDDLIYGIAEMDGLDVGCGALCLQNELPSPDNPSGKSAYLMNIYTRKPARGHNVGHSIVTWLIERAKEAGADKIYLEATDAGLPLYECLGFRLMNGMMKLE